MAFWQRRHGPESKKVRVTFTDEVVDLHGNVCSGFGGMGFVSNRKNNRGSEYEIRKTCQCYEVVPEVCRMSEPEDFYARGDAWNNVVKGVQHCGPVQQNSPGFVWVLYVDVMEPCDETHELGAGGAGLTILGDVRDGFVRGLFYFCGEGPY